MKLRSTFWSLTALLALAVCACSSAPTSPKTASGGKALELPPDLAANQKVIETRKENLLAANQSDPNDPRKNLAAKKISGAYIERSGNQRWLVVEQSAEDTWPTLREFWLERKQPIAIEIPNIGLIETGWAEQRISTPITEANPQAKTIGTRNKFRVRLERSAPGISEIFITHRGLVEQLTIEGEARWVSKDDPLVEAEYLSYLLQWFKNKLPGSQTTVAATSPVQDRSKARFIAGGSTELSLEKVGAKSILTDTLVVTEPLDIVWRRIGLALDRASFIVDNSDRTQAQFKILYSDATIEKELKGGASTEPAQRVDRAFLIQLKTVDQETHVVVLDERGQPETSSYAAKILKIVLDRLG